MIDTFKNLRNKKYSQGSLNNPLRPINKEVFYRIVKAKPFSFQHLIRMKTNNKSFFLIVLFNMIINVLSAQYTESDWDERDKWMDIDKMFNLVDLRLGSIVADIGCHEGYLTIHMAKKIGEEGKVFAVDVIEHRLQKLKKNAEKRNLTNITTVLGDYDNPKLPNNTLDAVFILDTYHDMKNYMTILEHVKKALKPGGHIVISEELTESAKGKSRSAQTNSHVLSPKYVRKEFEEAGFVVSETIENLGYWHDDKSRPIWALVATLPEE
jgi:ubiquinone/menaquinone biosynthesis C-methylase UbiE